MWWLENSPSLSFVIFDLPISKSNLRHQWPIGPKGHLSKITWTQVCIYRSKLRKNTYISCFSTYFGASKHINIALIFLAKMHISVNIWYHISVNISVFNIDWYMLSYSDHICFHISVIIRPLHISVNISPFR